MAHTVPDEVETVWEGQRWWVGSGFRAQAPRFLADGEHERRGGRGLAWPSTKDAVAPAAALAAMKDSATALRDKTELAATTLQASGSFKDSATAILQADGDSAEDQAAAAALTAGLLEAASPGGTAAEGWVWAREGWAVVRDGSTDDEGWTYATDWARFCVPREGGRKSQRKMDVVRRRRLTCSRQLVADVAAAEACAEGAGLLGAVAALEELCKAEATLEKEHTAVRLPAFVRLPLCAHAPCINNLATGGDGGRQGPDEEARALALAVRDAGGPDRVVPAGQHPPRRDGPALHQPPCRHRR